MNEIPNKVSPCPLLESNVEIRFEPNIPSEAVFGVIYQVFKNEFNDNLLKLPILQLPEHVRISDPNLIYQPYYRLQKGNMVIQIGPKVLGISNIPEYIGWSSFRSNINKYVSDIFDLKIFKQILRIGIRYVNFFDVDIFEHINLKFTMNDQHISSKQTSLRTSIQTGKFETTLNIANNVQTIRRGTLATGSILDIDTYIDNPVQNNFSDIDVIINDAHNEEKKIFFKLLKSEFVTTKLNPTYGEQI